MRQDDKERRQNEEKKIKHPKNEETRILYSIQTHFPMIVLLLIFMIFP